MTKSRYVYGIVDAISGICSGPCLVRVERQAYCNQLDLGNVKVLAKPSEANGRTGVTDLVLYSRWWSCLSVRFTRYKSKEEATLAFVPYLL